MGVDEKTPTGTCACLINASERSLCTNLAAANNYKESHLQQADNMALLTGAKVVYSAGFFVTVSPDSMRIAAKKCLETGANYCLNLSAPFLMQVPSVKGKQSKRTVVVTQGKDPTIVAQNGFTKEFAITALAQDKVVDTNGAGDAYVGGFLAALTKGKAVADCCKAGAYSAGVIVQYSGCTY